MHENINMRISICLSLFPIEKPSETPTPPSPPSPTSPPSPKQKAPHNLRHLTNLQKEKTISRAITIKGRKPNSPRAPSS